MPNGTLFHLTPLAFSSRLTNATFRSILRDLCLFASSLCSGELHPVFPRKSVGTMAAVLWSPNDATNHCDRWHPLLLRCFLQYSAHFISRWIVRALSPSILVLPRLRLALGSPSCKEDRLHLPTLLARSSDNTCAWDSLAA